MLLSINNKLIFAFSDPHGRHRDLQVPEGADIMICAGDAVEDDLRGGEYDDFLDWYGSFPAKIKLFLPGNHELSFRNGMQSKKAQGLLPLFGKHGILVVQDEVLDAMGIKFCFFSGEGTVANIDIPTGIDVLVTHYPPYGILDEDLGNPEILNFVLKSQPKYHLFGHIHSTAGQEFQLGQTICRNISVAK